MRAGSPSAHPSSTRLGYLPVMLLLLANLAATGMLIGLTWTIQLVHYPLFAQVGADAWLGYAAGHGRRITVLVAPWMLLEAGTAAALVAWRPPLLSAAAAWSGLALVGLIWLSTVLVQAPLYGRLSRRWDAEDHRRLVVTHGLRTACWTLRGMLLLAVLARVLDPAGR
jgi:hypothetical protein